MSRCAQCHTCSPASATLVLAEGHATRGVLHLPSRRSARKRNCFPRTARVPAGVVRGIAGNAHGGLGPKLLHQPQANDVCFTCHAGMRGPFLWGTIWLLGRRLHALPHPARFEHCTVAEGARRRGCAKAATPAPPHTTAFPARVGTRRGNKTHHRLLARFALQLPPRQPMAATTPSGARWFTRATRAAFAMIAASAQAQTPSSEQEKKLDALIRPQSQIEAGAGTAQGNAFLAEFHWPQTRVRRTPILMAWQPDALGATRTTIISLAHRRP